MLNLNIYDVSPVVWTGVMTDDVDLNRSGFYYAGINYLLKFIAMDLQEGDDVILCFDSKSFRKKVDDNYKKGRKIDFRVLSQLEFLYALLPECGFTCLKEKGYEADDLIASVVRENKNKYETINMITSDYDLAINVRNNVRLVSCNSLTNDVDRYNFKHAVFPGENIMFNTIGPYKVFCGDKSDHIKAITSPNGFSSRDLYNAYLSTLDTDFRDITSEFYSSREILEYYIDKLKQLNMFSDEFFKQIETNVELVYPKLIKLGDTAKPVGIDDIDKDKFIKILNCFYNKPARMSMRGAFQEVTDMDEILKKYAKRLHTGELAADYGMKFKDVKASMNVFMLKEF